MEWNEEAADAWNDPDVVIGVVRETDHEDGQALPVSQQCFQSWMEHARSEALAGDFGYPIGRRVMEFLTNEFEVEEDSSADLWNLMRRSVAEVFEKDVFRMATTLSNDILSVALCAREVLDLGLPPTLDARACLAAVRSLPALEWPSDLESLHTEIDAITMEIKGEELEVVSAGTVAGAATGDDVGRRTSEVESLASVASEVLGEELL